MTVSSKVLFIFAWVSFRTACSLKWNRSLDALSIAYIRVHIRILRISVFSIMVGASRKTERRHTKEDVTRDVSWISLPSPSSKTCVFHLRSLVDALLPQLYRCESIILSFEYRRDASFHENIYRKKVFYVLICIYRYNMEIILFCFLLEKHFWIVACINLHKKRKVQKNILFLHTRLIIFYDFLVVNKSMYNLRSLH